MGNKLLEDEDHVLLKRFNFSLKETLERYPDGVPEHLIAQALNLEEGEVAELYQDVVEKLRAIMKVGND